MTNLPFCIVSVLHTGETRRFQLILRSEFCIASVLHTDMPQAFCVTCIKDSLVFKFAAECLSDNNINFL